MNIRNICGAMALFAACAAYAAETYKNPILTMDFSDPDVIRVGDTYYMVSTTMSLFPGATILKSKDMVNWEYCAQPLKQLLNNDNYNLKNNKNAYASGMWACSMKYHNGKFHLLINEKRPVDGWVLQGWLLTATNPEGTSATELNYTAPLIMLACLGVAALLLGLLLKVVDRKKGLGLEEPNIK